MGSRVSALFAGPSVLGRRARARARVVCARVVCVRLRMPRSISLPLLSDPFQHGFPLVEITPHEHGRGCAREYSRAQRQQAAFSPLVSRSTHTGVLGALTLEYSHWGTRSTDMEYSEYSHWAPPRYYEAARELSPAVAVGFRIASRWYVGPAALAEGSGSRRSVSARPAASPLAPAPDHPMHAAVTAAERRPSSGRSCQH